MFRAMERAKYGFEKLSVLFAQRLELGSAAWTVVRIPRARKNLD